MDAVVKQVRARPEAKARRIVSPIGGLNARDAIANMPETDAIIADNVFVQPTWVEVRGGRSPVATFTGNAETTMAYSGLSSGQLYAGINNAGTRGIYRVDNAGGGSPGAALVGGAGNTIQAVTSTIYDWAQFGTGTVDAFYAVNGADNPVLFDGTTWYAITAISAPYALTGGPASLANFNQVAVYHSRLWFGQANTFNVFYLPQNVFAGALTELSLGPLFNLGGYLQAMMTVSIDNSAGANDYIAFVSNVGEVIVFQGYDPANAATWALSAHFRIGRPLATGRRAWQKLGSDAIILTTDGFVKLSQELLTDRTQQTDAVSDKIRKSVRDAVSQFGTYPGWQVLFYPLGTKLLVTVPTTASLGSSYEFVMNTLNGAWVTWGLFSSAFNAFCWETLNDALYYGTTGAVYQADTGTSDNNAAINCTIKPAFSYYDDPERQKTYLSCQPIFTVNGPLRVSIITNIDFDGTLPTGTVPLSQGNLPAWGSSWTGAYWGAATMVVLPWIGMAGAGRCATITMQFSALNLTLQWQATNFLYKTGGAFYGIG